MKRQVETDAAEEIISSSSSSEEELSISIDSEIERDDDYDVAVEREEEKSIKRENWLHEELFERHQFVIPVLAKKDLIPLDVSNETGVIIGDENGLHCKRLIVGNELRMYQLSYNDIDLFAVAKRGALFGMTYNDKEPFKSIKIRYSRCKVTHHLFATGVLLSSGGVSLPSEAREKVFAQTYALLRYICGLSDLVVNREWCQNIVTRTQINRTMKLSISGVTDLCNSMGTAYTEPCFSLKYKDLLGRTSAEGVAQTKLTDEEGGRISFVIFPRNGHVMSVGGRSLASIEEAHRVLMLNLSPYAALKEGRRLILPVDFANKKRRL